MIFAIALSGIFLLLIGVSNSNKFRFYGLMTALICTVLSIELIAKVNGLTLGVLAALTIISLPFIRIKLYDIIGWLLITLPCIFWLGTQEFVDGFAYSHILVAIGVALVCILLFDKQKRQTLCALVLLTSFIVCYASNAYFNAIDIATATAVAVIFAENYALSTDLMTIDSYGTSL